LAKNGQEITHRPMQSAALPAGRAGSTCHAMRVGGTAAVAAEFVRQQIASFSARAVAEKTLGNNARTLAANLRASGKATPMDVSKPVMYSDHAWCRTTQWHTLGDDFLKEQGRLIRAVSQLAIAFALESLGRLLKFRVQKERGIALRRAWTAKADPNRYVQCNFKLRRAGDSTASSESAN
jgi:hypothetical protein